MKLNIPHERRKVKLKALEMNIRVKRAELKQEHDAVKAELAALKPPKRK